MTFIINPYRYAGGAAPPASTWDTDVAAMSPYAWWKLDDGDYYIDGDNVAADASGNGRTAAFDSDETIPTRWQDPLVEGSRYGVQVDTSGSSPANLRDNTASFVDNLTAGSFTVGCLIESTNTSTVRRLIRAASGANTFQVILNYPSSGDIRFYYSSSTSDADSLLATGAGWNDGDPHLLLFEYDATAETQSIWLDGTEIATRSRAASAPSPTGTFDWLFYPGTEAAGTIADEYLFFTRTLTSSEHSTLAGYTRPGSHPFGASWSPPYNTAAHLDIPVPGLASTEAMHPDVVDFGTAWNGYRYWMAFTPYNGDFNTEEPCIVATNDIGTDAWEVPTGFTNPIASDPAGDEHYADTDLLYDPDGDLLYVFAVHSDRSTFQNIVSWNTDGSGTWSTRTTVLSGADGTYANPSIVPTASGWRLYYNKGTGSLLYYRDSTTAPDSGYGAEQTCSGLSPITFQNLNMVYDGGDFVAVIGDVTAGGADGRLFFARSTDGGDTFEVTGEPVLEASASGWDQSGIYRCSVLVDTDGEVVVTSGEIDVYYSAYTDGSPDQWGTAHIQVPREVLQV